MALVPENSQESQNQHLFLLRTSEKGVWIYPALGLEEALTKAGVQPLRQQASEFFRFLTKLMARTGMVRNFWTGKKGIYLAILMGRGSYYCVYQKNLPHIGDACRRQS